MLGQIMPQDLLKFGLIPEFVGHPRHCCLRALGRYVDSHPCRSRVTHFLSNTEVFDLGGVELILFVLFEPDAVAEIARQAMEQNTGARGLRAILEEIMLDIMYDIPSRNDVAVRITRESATGSQPPKIILKEGTKQPNHQNFGG